MTELEQIEAATRELNKSLTAVQEAHAAIARNDLILVANNVTALLAWIIDSNPPEGVCSALEALQLARKVPYDPAKHGEEPSWLPGDPYFEYTKPLRDALENGRKHLRPLNAGKLN